MRACGWAGACLPAPLLLGCPLRNAASCSVRAYSQITSHQRQFSFAARRTLSQNAYLSFHLSQATAPLARRPSLGHRFRNPVGAARLPVVVIPEPGQARADDARDDEGVRPPGWRVLGLG